MNSTILNFTSVCSFYQLCYPPYGFISLCLKDANKAWQALHLPSYLLLYCKDNKIQTQP